MNDGQFLYVFYLIGVVISIIASGIILCMWTVCTIACLIKTYRESKTQRKVEDVR